MFSKKTITFLTFLIIFFSNINKVYSIEADVFVQSTVNRASKLLSEDISKEDIVKLEIQTGVPRTYEYKDNIFTKIE